MAQALNLSSAHHTAPSAPIGIYALPDWLRRAAHIAGYVRCANQRVLTRTSEGIAPSPVAPVRSAGKPSYVLESLHTEWLQHLCCSFIRVSVNLPSGDVRSLEEVPDAARDCRTAGVGY